MDGKRVNILTSDSELYGMASLWLTDEGYEITDEAEADIIIVDMESAGETSEALDKDKSIKGKKILYIVTDAKKPEETEKKIENSNEDSIERPFLQLEFLSFVRGAENVGQKNRIRVDVKRKRIYSRKMYVSLTDKEYAVFRALYDRMGETVPREELARIARSGEQETNAADVYICMLRRKLTELLGDDPIKTVRGRGYSLAFEKNR